MGRTVINETENKQTVILNDSAEGVSGGFFNADMEWHDLRSESSFNFTGKDDTLYGSMAKALATGNYLSGTFTAGLYTNEWQTLLDTGLDTLHGIMMWDIDGIHILSNSATAQMITFMVKPNGHLLFTAIITPANDTVSSSQYGTIVMDLDPEVENDNKGIEGFYRVTGGIIEYKGRYNKNGGLQSIIPDSTWEWIAW